MYPLPQAHPWRVAGLLYVKLWDKLCEEMGKCKGDISWEMFKETLAR
jgi:hypothetical protein